MERRNLPVLCGNRSNPGFRTQSVTLMTPLLDAAIPAADLAALYLRRLYETVRFLFLPRRPRTFF